MNNKSVDVPKIIKEYLVQDEIIERHFYLRKRFSLRGGDNLYASNKRLFHLKGDTIRDISYDHISSIEFRQERNWLAIILGILLLALGCFCIWEGSIEWIPFLNDSNAWIVLAIGFFLTIMGIIKSQFIVLSVVGLTNRYPLSGNKTTLDSLFRFVREKKT